MTEIIKGNVNAEDKRNIYTLTRARGTSIQDCDDGFNIDVAMWLEYTDTDRDGNDVHVLSILDTERHKYETISRTFREEFEYIARLMDDELFSVHVVKGTTKSGRTFVTCELA